MTLRAFALSSLSALALAGCAAGPDYVAQTPVPAQSGPFLAVGNPSVTLEPVPGDWWRLYNDAVLDGLIADALAANTDVRQAVARIERARAGLRGARADRLPQASIGAGGGYGRQSARRRP
jgi:outer membrane protein TolC